ncbi:MAG: hypothetical protein Q4F93_09540 [bacterium]|nr:hypothetical protein [bacterium]
MIKIEKTYGVRGVSDYSTLIRLQELISLAKQQYGWVGKAVIDTEKITYYKFGLKLGLLRFATNGLVVNENGIICDCGIFVPEVIDRQVLTDLCVLFNMDANF